jgi:predicted NAD/FAD-binding protein
MKIAIVGSGISGLGCAHALLAEKSHGVQITLYESSMRPGGHTNSVDVALDGTHYPVDTGFLVFNERTYPRLIRLFDELDVPVAASDMSFSVSLPINGLFGRRAVEWAGTDLAGVFAQRRNLASPAFMRMLADLLRFNRQATRIALGTEAAATVSLGEFLDRNRYSQPFRRMYLLPMAAAIWSCPMATMLAYPLQTFVRFCHNHGLLQIDDRPQWRTVRGGARQYVERIVRRIADVRLGDPVQRVSRDARTGKVLVVSSRGRDSFDQVVLAAHSDQSLRLLGDATEAERSVLASVGYQPNRAILHTDTRLMPATRRVWSSWNYLSDGSDEPNVSVTYWLNRLQPLPFTTPVFVSLNPLREPDPDAVLAEFDYAHPVFDADAIAAQQRLPQVQGSNRVWFAGAWTGYGFHEDGLKSGFAVAERVRALLQQPAALAA